MESTSLKQFFMNFRHSLKQVFNFHNLFLMLKSEDLAIMYKRKELGLTHTLNIDDGKQTIILKFDCVEKYEGIILDNKKDMSAGNFTGFNPEFSKREIVSGGFVRNNIICWPVHMKNQIKGNDEVLMMIQMGGGQRASHKYSAIDLTLMNIMAKVAGGALLKIKSERITMDSLGKSQKMFDTFKQLLSERNHALLNQMIKSTFGKLFKF